MRVAGAALVWLGCILVSVRACRYRKISLRTLEDLVSAVEVLAREISLGRRALPELLDQLGKRYSPPVRQLFLRCRAELGEECGFCAAWEKTLGESGLDEEVRHTLEPLGWQLGRYDPSGQEHCLEHMRTMLDRQLERKRVQTARQLQTIGALGVTAGGFLSLMLI